MILIDGHKAINLHMERWNHETHRWVSVAELFVICNAKIHYDMVDTSGIEIREYLDDSEDAAIVDSIKHLLEMAHAWSSIDDDHVVTEEKINASKDVQARAKALIQAARDARKKAKRK